MTQSTLAIGSRVKVTTHRGAFYRRSYDQEGVVVALTNERVDVLFDDGTEDFGSPFAVTVISQKIKVGDKVKVIAEDGGLFYSRYQGQTGIVGRFNTEGDIIYVTFADGKTDYGRTHNVELAQPETDAQGFISNRENTSGVLPVARDTLVDILYKDGTIVLNQKAGSGEGKRSVNKPGNSYSNYNWRFSADGSYNGTASIVGYRLAGTAPEVKVAGKPSVFADFKAGMKVKLISEGDRIHQHWGFREGQVYECVNRGVRSGEGSTCTKNWAGWIFEVVEATLDDQLAALKAELEGIKDQKVTAETELANAKERVTTKQAVVDRLEAERVALLERVTKHGLQFIGEVKKAITALDAYNEGSLEVGVILLAVTPADEQEHVPGKTYKVIQRDRGDTSEWKLQSEYGYGWWIRNTELVNYTVVA